MRIPLLSSLFGRGVGRPSANDPRAWGMPGIVSEAGEVVDANSALQLDVVQAILESMAGSISSLPLMVFERDGDAKRPARDHYLFDLLHRRPNESQTKQEFFDEQQRHLMFWRNAYSEIVVDEGGRPIALLPIHPQRVLRVEKVSGTIMYEVAGLGTAPNRKIPQDFMWHVRKAPLTIDGLRGAPIFETARETFGRAIAVERYGARFFRNSGKSGGIIKHPGKFQSKEDRDVFLDNWRSSGATGGNQHADRLLTHGVEYVALNVMNDEAQFIETVGLMETKLCGLWSMPPHRVSRLARATNNNIEHQGIDYVVHTIAPYVCGWEQSARHNLLVEPEDEKRGIFIEHNVDGLLRGDIASRYKAYATARQWGWLSVNDIRKLENLDPIGNAGDTYLQPLNMQPVGSANTSEDQTDE